LTAAIGARTYDLALPEGAEADEARLHYWLGDEVARVDGPLDLGRISVVVAAGIRRTVLKVPGHVAIDVTDLPDGARVELALVGDRTLPEGLRIWVERGDYDLPSTHLGSSRRLDDEGETTVLLPGPGRYVAELDSTGLSLADPTFEVRADTRRVELIVR